MRTLQPRERKVVAVAILVAILAGAWFALIDPIVVGFIGRAEERSDLTATYQRNERVLAGIATWRAQADRQKMTERQYAIVAPTRAVAVENLKQRLTRMADSEGAVVPTISELPAEAPEGWVRVRVDLQLTMSQLYKSLNRLENEAPYVIVGYVSVVADRANQTGHLATMDVRIEVSAPVRVSQPS